VTGETALEWEGRVDLLSDPFTRRDMLRVGVISIAMMWILVALMGLLAEGELVILPPVVLLIVVPVVVVLFFLAVVLLGVRLPIVFVLDSHGAGWSSGKRASWASRATMVLGALSARPSAAGAGMLGLARESGTVPWQDVVHVRPYSDRRVIALADSWHTLLRLYCTPETYDAALAFAISHAAGDTATAPKPLHRPDRRGLAAFALAVIASAGVVSWSWTFDSAREATLLALVVFAIGLAAFGNRVVRRICGMVGIISAAYLVVRVAIEALDPITMFSSGEVIGYGWELDTPLLVLAVSGLCILLALSVIALFGERE
jgi:hypothetical protein